MIALALIWSVLFRSSSLDVVVDATAGWIQPTFVAALLMFAAFRYCESHGAHTIVAIGRIALLDVYTRALEFHALAIALVPRRGCRALRDQLERASLGVVLCIAEGAGRTAGGDKRRFYEMARGSATPIDMPHTTISLSGRCRNCSISSRTLTAG